MPKFKFSFSQAGRSLALAAAMAALPSLQGCFESAEEDSPYSVPAGRTIESAHLEVEPDGTVLLLTQQGMFYAHTEPVNEEERIPRLRNFESIVYRRTTGGWSATSFKNLQNEQRSLSLLMPDARGRFHALVLNGSSIRRYRFIDGTWAVRPKADYPQAINYHSQSFNRNWSRSAYMGIESDSMVITVDHAYEYTYSGLVIQDGAAEKSFKIDSRFGLTPMAFHVGANYRLLVAMQNQYRDMNDTVQPLLVLARWDRGRTPVEQIVLLSGNVRECFISPYRGGTGLFTFQDSTFMAFRLDSAGYPDSGTRTEAPLSAQRGMPMFAVDSAGCYKGLLEEPDFERRIPSFVHWNTCQAADTARLVLPLVADASGYYATSSIEVRLDASGRTLAAIAMTRGETNQDRNFYHRLQPTRLFFAELRDGVWALETVASEK